MYTVRIAAFDFNSPVSMMRQQASSSTVENRFPTLFASVVETAQGFTLTVYLRTASSGDGVLLLINRPADTIDEARAIIGKIAQERSIAEAPWIEFHMSKNGRSYGLLH